MVTPTDLRQIGFNAVPYPGLLFFFCSLEALSAKFGNSTILRYNTEPMRLVSIRRTTLQQVGIEGSLLIFATIPFVFFTAAPTFHKIWYQALAIFSSLMFFASAYYILRRPDLGKIFAGAAATGSLVIAGPYLSSNPATALVGAVIYIAALHNLSDFKIRRSFTRSGDEQERGLQRTRWASISLIGLSLAVFLAGAGTGSSSNYSLLVAALITQALSINWSISQSSNMHKMLCIVVNCLTLTTTIFLFKEDITWIGTLIVGLTLWLLMPDSVEAADNPSDWWEPLLNHPGRVTLVTFALLCLLGTLLLMLPTAASGSQISLINAAFTSVSAVCVTGLIVLDTPNDFSFLGQFFIILLIQLGGLGIMTVTTVALHALGRRLSLSQERVLASTFNSDHQSLVSSLKQILAFTAVMEIGGAVILSLLFYRHGIAAGDAIWKGIFTSISAFCNAGFALQSDSLIPYQKNALILHTVAVLIVCGGIAPAVTLIIPRWLTGKSVPVAARIALVTSVALLIFGTFVFLAFEWNGVLQNLSLLEKIHNAWFQSVTLRTAGFNSVPLENVISPTFLVMICMMFIGGSPGGTAGGVKTTTFGVLAATFWSCALGYDDISLQNRRILPETVFKAVTTVVAGMLVLFLVTLMLEITQFIGARDLIFEATSALGTVGLSTGATGKLDSIGKIIIMFAMFAGRVGPVTLFTLLSRERPANGENLLEARINLT